MILGEEHGNLEILDTESMKIVSTKHIKNFGQYLNYLRPTSNEEEFGIATFNGLFFFTVTESKGKKVI
mgnify:FL=1